MIQTRSLSILILLVICFFTAHAQYNTHEKYTQLRDSISLGAAGFIPAAQQGYTIYLPADNKANGAIVFIMGQKLDSVENKDELTVLPAATANGLAVIFVSSGNPVDFFFTDKSIDKVDALLGEISAKYDIPTNNMLFAGLSLSGTRAMKYAIYCTLRKSKAGIKPKALVLCDAPLDMIRFWDECERAVERHFNEIAAGSGYWVTEYLKANLGGTPDEKKANYIAYSPYCYKAKNGGNAAYLLNLPIRAYHEPDVDWWIENRRKDYYSMNSLDLAALINDMKLQGNTRAELVTTCKQRKGVENNSSPHTWSMIDPEELVKWFVAL